MKENKIDYYETGIEHGTITALIEGYKFEITSLREDILTDGRHAKVKFSKNWKEDALRRDFTINSIYADEDGNLFDPFEGKKDLENGFVNFIGDADKRIKEDYLRILRYLRFFAHYSKHPHNPELIRKLKINIGGISKLSKERLLNELKKITHLEILEKLADEMINLTPEESQKLALIVKAKLMPEIAKQQQQGLLQQANNPMMQQMGKRQMNMPMPNAAQAAQSGLLRR